ncbi:hypothetical protein BH11PSE12_BH11PSE12_17250 [soil metagenome]
MSEYKKYGNESVGATSKAPLFSGEGARLRAPAAVEGAKKASCPTVAPTVSTPINNMGENLVSDAYRETLVVSGRRVKTVLTRIRTENQLCIVDWLNFTVHEDTFQKMSGYKLVSTEDVICEASKQLQKIFGFGITSQRDQGMNFYRESWVLGDDMGFVCLGGQENTMLVTLTGQGCTIANQGWETRLYAFLSNTNCVRPSISRIDLAHDDFAGKYLSVDWAETQWHVRGFNTSRGGRKVNIECVGNWHAPTGAGRTLNIGMRTSGKFLRVYEKGRQLGDVTSEWCRAELEIKSSDRIIPLDILLQPSDYFAGAYPCFEQFAHIDTPKRVKLREKVAHIVTDAAVKITKHQYGKYLSVFRQLWGDKAALDAVCNQDKNAWPKRLKPLGASTTSGPEPLHKSRIVRTSEDLVFNPVPSANFGWKLFSSDSLSCA